MPVPRQLCIATNVIATLVIAVIMGLCVWFLVKRNCAVIEGHNLFPGNNNNIPDDFNDGLLINAGSELILRSRNEEESISLLKVQQTLIYSFDYCRNKTIYYNVYGLIRSTSKQYPVLKPFNDKQGVMAFAVDFISENIYALDFQQLNIYVLDMKNKHSAILFSDLCLLRDIAINPFHRWIFMRTSKSIYMAHLDGSELEEIVKDTEIEAFAPNLIGPYIYWASGRAIQCLDIMTRKIVNVATAANTVRSLAVFDKDLYFMTDASNSSYSNEIYRCYMDLNGACGTHKKISSSGYPMGIRVYNPHLWEKTPNPCEYQNGDCHHLCLLKRDSEIGRVCACSLGWKLNDDGRTCSPVDEYILNIQSLNLRGRILDKGLDRAFVDAIFPRRLDISFVSDFRRMAYDIDSRRHLMVVGSGSKLYLIDLLGRFKDRLLSTIETYSMYPVLDWISKENLYYISASRNPEDKTTVMLRGFDRYYDQEKYQKRIYNFNNAEFNPPRAIGVEPNYGYLFISAFEISTKTARIFKIVADGSESTEFRVGVENFSVNETGLGVDHIEARLYWFNADFSQVQHASIDATDFKSFKISFMENPVWLNVHGQWLYISNPSETWRVEKTSGLQPQRILTMPEGLDPMLSAAKGFGARLQPIRMDHPCIGNNGNCSRYCIAVPGKSKDSLRRVCTCNDNEKLDEDGKSCRYVG